MRRHLERLREKPDHHKRNISLVIAGLVTGLFVLGWFTTLDDRFKDVNDSTAAARRAISETTSAIQANDGTKSLADEYNKLRNQLNTLPE